MPLTRRRRLLLALALLAGAMPAHAEVSTVRIARQYGLGFLPLMVMEDQKLFEKRAAEAGLSVNTEWVVLGTPAAANDGLLSGDVHFVPNGPPAFLTMWSRTKGTRLEVKGVGTLVTLPMWLNTRNPKINSIRDFTDSDRIAVTAVKTSIPAIILQMAAEREFGKDQYTKLDKYTVSLPHPDGMNALISGSTEITSHFTSPPFQQMELKHQGIRKILSSDDVMGGPSTFSLVFTTVAFRSENPKAFKAFHQALRDAQEFIKQNKDKAADIYLLRSKEGGVTRDVVLEILNDPTIQFTPTPQKMMAYASFLKHTGLLKAAPQNWKELFFEEVHDQPGD